MTEVCRSGMSASVFSRKVVIEAEPGLFFRHCPAPFVGSSWVQQGFCAFQLLAVQNKRNRPSGFWFLLMFVGVH